MGRKVVYHQPHKGVVFRLIRSGLGGLDKGSGEIIQDFWRSKNSLHINVKELTAAVNTTMSLAKPGETVLLSVDNMTSYWYLTKGGGRKAHLNQMVHEEQSHLEGKLGAIRTYVGRQHFKVGGGQEEYSLNPQIFQALLRKYKGWLEPKTDMLASPNSHQLKSFVSRWPHWQATAVDALKCPLEGLGDMYALPPWKIISQWLQRLKLEKGAKCLMVVPYWVGAIWWPQLIKLRIPKSPVFMVKPDWGVFSNVLGEAMPPQRYP